MLRFESLTLEQFDARFRVVGLFRQSHFQFHWPSANHLDIDSTCSINDRLQLILSSAHEAMLAAACRMFGGSDEMPQQVFPFRDDLNCSRLLDQGELRFRV